MQETDPTYEHAEASEAILPHRTLRRLLYLSFAVLAVMLLVLLPPLINVNRFQRRIATSISQSLGRPVHLDRVTLNLLPLPGFTFENFVVDEDPAFGTEPIIRANSVRATLRISSLWRKRVEFSTISFTEPSVNLVHTASGKWNLESILLHAAHIEAAPTAQKKAGPAPRFPYIEATGARLNLKLDREKTPISLTDADFALWLPDPQQWHVRLSAHPARTDTNVTDTGTLELEGTLGRAPSLGQVPISLRGAWRTVPLGEASRVLLGHDAGLRGEMTITANAQGPISHSSLQTTIHLTDVRRDAFIPERPLALDLQCLGTATGNFHGFEDIHCSWPPAGSSSAPTLALTGTIPDIRKPDSSAIQLDTPGLGASTLLEWLHVASRRVPANITAAGTLTGSLTYQPSAPAPLQGQLLLTGTSLINPHSASTPDGNPSLVTGEVSLQSISLTTPDPRHKQPHPAQLKNTPTNSTSQLSPTSLSSNRSLSPLSPTTSNKSVFQLSPTSLALGGKDPAILEGRFDASGYILHLTGMASIARLQALSIALPQFGDGLAQILPTNRAAGPFRVDLTATRLWGQPQTWTDNTPLTTHPAPSRTHTHHRN
jgi:AsmA family